MSFSGMPRFRAIRDRQVPELPLTPKRSQLPPGFYLDTSSLETSTPTPTREELLRRLRGLYTRRRIAAGKCIGEYYGQKLTVSEAYCFPGQRSNYQFEVRKNGKVQWILDGELELFSSFIRFVNAANWEHEQNCYFVQRQNRIFLIARCDILPGQELLAWYGRDTAALIAQ